MYSKTQAAMDGATSSASRMSAAMSGAGRAFASSAPMIAGGTLAITAVTGAANTARGELVNYTATGALVGSAVGPWGTALGALSGMFLQQASSINEAHQALNSLAQSTSWDELRAKASASAESGTWKQEAAKFVGLIPVVGAYARTALDASNATANVSDRLKDAGTSVTQAISAAQAGGSAWESYRTSTLAAADGNRQVKQWLDEVAAGAANTAAAQQGLIASNFAAANTTYATANAFLTAARQAGFTASEINTLSAAASRVPTGSSILFSTNALSVMQQIQAMKAAAGSSDIGDKVGAVKGMASAQKSLAGALTAPPAIPKLSAPSISTPKSGGGGGGKKAKKAYNVDVYDPFMDDGWQQLTGGQISTALAKMQTQANKAFAAMHKGSKTFSKSMKDLAHGKELKKAFKEIAADANEAIASMQSSIADLNKDMEDMGKNIAKSINPDSFGMNVEGATDFFGNQIGGSLAAAYQAQLTQMTDNLLAEQGNLTTLSGWGLDGDYLQELLTNNPMLLDALAGGSKEQALSIYNTTKTNDSIASKIGAQTAASTTAYAADRAEAAALQGQVNVLAAFVNEVNRDAKDGKLSKKELAQIAKFEDSMKRAFKAAMK
jgi:hypothetical protein